MCVLFFVGVSAFIFRQNNNNKKNYEKEKNVIQVLFIDMAIVNK